MSIPEPDPAGAASPNAADAVKARRSHRRQRQAMVLRVVLLLMSSGGTIGTIVLWALGHPNMAWRLLAGDVLAIVLLLLAL